MVDVYGGVGFWVEKLGDLDGVIEEMIVVDWLVLFDCRVVVLVNCFLMILLGKVYNEMLFLDEVNDEVVVNVIFVEGKLFV